MPDRAATTDEAPMPDLTGRTLGDFRLLRKIGQGGMGQVYLARQLSLKREVALKILRRDLADSLTAHRRFQAEAEAVARISHPNITQVYAVGEQDGLRFMALEYVDGRNLRDYLDRKGPPDLPVALAIMKQVAAALQKAGELGLVHRDIKPENILLTRKVEVKVTDFGLSTYYAGGEKPLSITQSGMTLGTPLYMSPEQVQGKPVDHRSDLYSFGVTCYHLLAGYPPFTGPTAFEVAVKHVQQEAEPLQGLRPDLPPEVCGLVARLMMKAPADRYQSAKDVIRDLSRIQKGGVSAPPAGTGAVPMPSTAYGPLSLQVSLTGSAVGGVAVTAGGTVIPVPVPAPPSRWPWRVLGLVGVTALGGLGWWGYEWAHPVVVPPPPPAVVGLPDVPAPTVLVAARERELRDAAAKPPSAAQARAALDLGLHYAAEHRLDDADAVFKELDGVRLKPAEAPVSPQALAKFGQAVVLALRDKPQDSVAAFTSAVGLLPRGNELRKEVDKFFFEHTAFSQAVSSAVARNADNLEPLKQKLPATLEWLRSPSGVLTRPR
jgi:eukaryotic-like serine/threonine-protein kinase